MNKTITIEANEYGSTVKMLRDGILERQYPPCDHLRAISIIANLLDALPQSICPVHCDKQTLQTQPEEALGHESLNDRKSGH
ncbi:MAG: hypothetical protein A2W23_00225 [Planctomycetes bacterium RBG_16_43_13]|nr:MAG: hypothetical protein A2W23_00225 [Planctomycetes bacterium RBG_16_43_13]